MRETKELTLLPDFAAFILKNHKDSFLSFSRKMLRDMDLPLLRRMTVEEGDQLADKSNMELLISLTNRNPAQHIEKAVDRWRKSQFPRATRNHFVVDDVTGIGHTRKLSFLEFLPLYTTDPKTIVDICAEIDTYILEYMSTTLHNFVGIIDDRIHEYVEHLERRTRELQESNASLEEFAYAASHDLKEPLRKISIFIKLLNESMSGASDKDRLLYDRILASTERMSALIDDLLSLSLLSKETQPERCSLQKVLSETLQVLDQKIEETGAKIRSTDLPEATIIPSQFGLLFQNLLSNSLKFTRQGVEPVINVSHRSVAPEEALQTYGLEKTPAIEIVVEDNGIGFNNTYQEKIFAVFQRLHNQDQYEGTGIGLAICRRIAKNHNGIITASGEPGKGATFRVIIPGA
jgi:signal transduction histidine kinase